MKIDISETLELQLGKEYELANQPRRNIWIVRVGKEEDKLVIVWNKNSYTGPNSNKEYHKTYTDTLFHCYHKCPYVHQHNKQCRHQNAQARRPSCIRKTSCLQYLNI